MKIYITGSVGSGKSTLARQAAAILGVSACELDQVVYTPDPGSDSGNRKRPVAERDALFEATLAAENWVMEDAGRDCFSQGMDQADQVVLLEPPPLVRDFRIIRRWIRQRQGREACGYIPDLKMLRLMFRWRRNYDSGRDGLKARLAPYGGKLIRLTSSHAAERWLEQLRQAL